MSCAIAVGAWNGDTANALTLGSSTAPKRLDSRAVVVLPLTKEKLYVKNADPLGASDLMPGNTRTATHTK